MKALGLGWIVASVLCSSFAHFALKLGALRIGLMSEPARIAWDVSMNGWLLTGAILHVTALALWVAGLRQVELSVAYPFIALGLVLVSTLSWMFLGESMNVARIAGILLIAAGVLVVARA